MAVQSVRGSSARSMARRGIATTTSPIISSVSGTFCQKIHCQRPFSEYQPSTAPAIFCEKTKRNA